MASRTAPTSPYRAFRDPMRALLGIERADRATMAAELAGAVERLAPELVPMLPLLGTVAQVDTPMTPEVEAIDPQFLPDRRADAVIGLLDHLLGDAAALVVEDAQWTDGASDALLHAIVASLRRRPGWSMVVVRRGAADWGFAPDAPRLELGPLQEAPLRELLTSLTTVPLRPHEVERMLARAAGSPLVLAALVRLGRERALSMTSRTRSRPWSQRRSMS